MTVLETSQTTPSTALECKANFVVSQVFFRYQNMALCKDYKLQKQADSTRRCSGLPSSRCDLIKKNHLRPSHLFSFFRFSTPRPQTCFECGSDQRELLPLGDHVVAHRRGLRAVLIYASVAERSNRPFYTSSVRAIRPLVLRHTKYLGLGQV